MEINICLTKKDIVTQKMGANYRIITHGIFCIVFTKEAFEEFVNDVHAIDSGEKEDPK